MLTAPARPDTGGDALQALGRGAALSGLLAGAAGLATAEVLGRLLPGASSPVLAVGARVVGLTPASLRGPAISTVGTADKPLLLLGILLVCAGLAAWGGVLALRSPRRAEALVAVLSLVVLAAQLGQPHAGPAAVVVAAALLLVTVGVLRSLLRLAPGGAGQDRRAFLTRGVVVGLGVLGAGGVVRYLQQRADVSALRTAVGLPVPVRRAPGDLAAADLRVPGMPDVLTSNAVF
ncbi:MAG: sulfite oxidase-like oxidoreductase, partial [Frankiales bacterium]|nr:sulfite oxidase-like oxidoreductase [Frankiales bacterium]